ncbi:MAG: hypothetical protein Q8N23_08885 [Archangium sp.]|nr:hypothetical protein [Archangium sp.]MDP3573559.1 hypothetical protein [Archangium sp.]
MLNKSLFAVSCALALTACPEKKADPVKAEVDAGTAAAAVPEKKVYKALSRIDFNARAQERFLPLFWRTDANKDGSLDPAELVTLIGPWTLSQADLVKGDAFTPKFDELYAQLQTQPDESKLAAEEKTRRDALRLELSQGKATLVETDLTVGTDADRKAFDHFARAAALIEKLYARQHGGVEQSAAIPADDTLSRAVSFRNQSPFCVAPATEKDAACNALSPAPARLFGLYPAAIQADPKFCATLEKEKNKADLMGHFSVVTEDGKGFKAVPYTEAFKDDMEAVAVELESAAALFGDDELALKNYLGAAAKAFRTNDWEPANEAWVAMGALNSKWYLRVGPDETYGEPCSWKAHFHLQLARINLASLEWQKKLEPVKAEMENTLAALAGAPYKARDVQFKLPDFIDVTINAADQRNPHGATIGQSLPNWGKVAEKGGRTVVMTNLYTDADSRENLEKQVASLYCKATFDGFSSDPQAALLSVVLHEAAHNLGPAHDYKVKGKTDDEAFGGPLASTMEELKAQTSALFFTWWLVEKKLLTEEEAKHATLRDIVWGFGHISRGMYDGAQRPKPYSQLASIQLGSMLKAGAITWKAEEKAANGADVGCFEVDLAKWRPAVNDLGKRVLAAKGKADKKDAEAMKASFVDAKDEWANLRTTIAERWLRAPKATFVYSVKR